MLDKELCKKCIENARGILTSDGFEWRGWIDSDEHRWSRGKVRCRVKEIETDFDTIDIDKDAPDWCLFKLEYILKEDERNAK